MPEATTSDAACPEEGGQRQAKERSPEAAPKTQSADDSQQEETEMGLPAEERTKVFPIDGLPAGHPLVTRTDGWTGLACISSATRSIYAYLGKCILHPTGAVEVAELYEDSITVKYQTQLTDCEKISVRTGDQYGLYCLSFDDREKASRWLQDNPMLKTTLVTSFPSPGEVCVWLRLQRPVDFPGTVVNGVRWHGRDGQVELTSVFCLSQTVDVVGEPVTVQFQDLNWDSFPALKFWFEYPSTVKRFGDATRNGLNGDLKLNAHLWGGILTKYLGIRFDPGTKVFIVRHPDGDGEREVSAEWVTSQIVRLFSRQAAQDGCEILAEYTEPRYLQKILDTVRTHGALNRTAKTLTIPSFVQTALVAEAKASVTSGELWDAYQTCCQAIGCPAQPKQAFFGAVKAAIATVHGIGSSHSVKRGDKNCNGYRGIRLKLMETG